MPYLGRTECWSKINRQILRPKEHGDTILILVDLWEEREKREDE